MSDLAPRSAVAPSQPVPTKRKPIFDLMRRLMGRGFSQSEVDAIDDALDHSLDTGLETRADGPVSEKRTVASKGRVADGPSVPAIRRKDRFSLRRKRKVGAAGTALIKRFEGCAKLRRDGLVEAYPDPGTGGSLGQ